MEELFKMPERISFSDKKLNPMEKLLNLSRYEYAAYFINQSKTEKNPAVLDAACGFGDGSKILQKKTGASVIGIDNDSSLIKSLTKKNNSKKIKFVVGNIKSLPFKDQTFDFIVCFETIEHLKKEDGLKALLEFKRVLKKNGFLIISSPNVQLTRLIKKAFPKYKNPFHLYEYDPGELKNLLTKIKMKVVAAKGQYLFFPLAYLFPRFFSFLKFLFLPSQFFPFCLSRYFVFTAKKIK